MPCTRRQSCKWRLLHPGGAQGCNDERRSIVTQVAARDVVGSERERSSTLPCCPPQGVMLYLAMQARALACAQAANAYPVHTKALGNIQGVSRLNGTRPARHHKQVAHRLECEEAAGEVHCCATIRHCVVACGAA